MVLQGQLECWLSLSVAFLTLRTSPYHFCRKALTICILKTLCSPDQVFISLALDTAQAVVLALKPDTSHQCFPTLSQLRQLFYYDM